MRFKDKTYIITLLLFLLFLNAGIFSLAYYTNQRSVSAATELCHSEQAVIVEAFEDDIKYLGPSGRQQIMYSYAVHYVQKDIGVCFVSADGETIYTSFPKGLYCPPDGKTSTQRYDGRRIYLISETIADGQYVFTYAKDLTYLDDDFKSISVVFVLTSIGASALLAVILFFVLHKLSSPLVKLREATDAISNGNFSIRADDSGKDEFSLLASDFNRMAEHISAQMHELEDSAKTKQQMLDNLAHEMRTPLTSIRGYAEYLLNANIDEKEKIEATEFIITESERLKAIGEKLLDDAFIRENGIKREKTNLGNIVADTAKKLVFYANNNGVNVVVDAKTVEADCDPLLVEMLLTNLANNAIKACKGNGRIILSCGIRDGSSYLSVSDNGVGMTAEQLTRITEPFYRTDKSRARNDGGTGLGLALCDRIVKAHGAALSFESTLGKGTTATVIFN
ncbi:MAG: HAMP domain-containing histidine kinase [Clostridia bacterium]|nr:HAMP domain-containing histidine kinase [Clostridia bacterium]